MSQTGAEGLALHGYDAQQILTHYYTGTTVARIAPGHLLTVLLQSQLRAVVFSDATRAGTRPLDPAHTYIATPGPNGQIALLERARPPAELSAGAAGGHERGPDRVRRRRIQRGYQWPLPRQSVARARPRPPGRDQPGRARGVRARGRVGGEPLQLARRRSCRRRRSRRAAMRSRARPTAASTSTPTPARSSTAATAPRRRRRTPRSRRPPTMSSHTPEGRSLPTTSLHPAGRPRTSRTGCPARRRSRGWSACSIPTTRTASARSR